MEPALQDKTDRDRTCRANEVGARPASDRRVVLPALVLSAAVVAGLFAWQGHKGFNLTDEGFLWYGVQRVMLGDVPIRDFMAYDPGRYYWSAGWMRLWGDNGVLALRGAVAIFQGIGLFVGLLLIARASRRGDLLFPPSATGSQTTGSQNQCAAHEHGCKQRSRGTRLIARAMRGRNAPGDAGAQNPCPLCEHGPGGTVGKRPLECGGEDTALTGWRAGVRAGVGAGGNVLLLLLAAGTLAAWMFPRHKFFDISLSILLIGAVAFLIERPIRRRYFLAGLCVGLAAVFGRNHGVYGVVGGVGAMAWLSLRRTEGPGLLGGLAVWGAGVTVGFLPVLAMAVLIPGFTEAFWQSIVYLFEARATNLPLPVPWPWRVDFAALPLADAVRAVGIGLFFLAVPAFGVLVIAWAFWRRVRRAPVPAGLAAAGFLAVPYAHYAFSRADIGHLAQGVFPLLVGLLVLLAGRRAVVKSPLIVLLAGVSVWIMLPFQPGWALRPGQPSTEIVVSGSTLTVDPGMAHEVAVLRDLADRHEVENRPCLVVPYWPGAYALLECESPMWSLCALFPRPERFQEAELRRIRAADPILALVQDVAPDHRDDLRFRNTHPLIYGYLLEHYEPVPHSPLPGWLVFRAKGRP